MYYLKKNNTPGLLFEVASKLVGLSFKHTSEPLSSVHENHFETPIHLPTSEYNKIFSYFAELSVADWRHVGLDSQMNFVKQSTLRVFESMLCHEV